MRKLTILFMLAAAAANAFSQDTAKAAVSPSNASAAFEMLKTLSGSWKGSVMDIPIDIVSRPASSGTAILNEWNTVKGPPDHEITMFYMEDGRLMAVHYCDAGNRARFEGKLSSDSKAVEFTFLDVTGSTKGGLVKRMIFTSVNPDTQTLQFTFIMPNGNPIELKGEFKRTK